MPRWLDGDSGMRKEDAALGWFLFGVVLLFATLVNTIGNLHSVPGIIEGGVWVELLAFGVAGTISMVSGAVTYRRSRRLANQTV